MASRRGVIATAGILGAITAASFAAWIIPQGNEATFVVTDLAANLDGVQNVHAAITADIEAEFQKMRDGRITPEEYVMAARSSTDQINSQIIGMVSVDAPQEWQPSYANYLESLRQTNSYIRETLVYANLLLDGAGQDRLAESLDEAEQYRSAAASFAVASNESRP